MVCCSSVLSRNLNGIDNARVAQMRSKLVSVVNVGVPYAPSATGRIAHTDSFVSAFLPRRLLGDVSKT